MNDSRYRHPKPTRIYCLLAQLGHLHDLQEQLPGVEHEVQLSPQVQSPLLAWFLGGHPAHLHESQEQA